MTIFDRSMDVLFASADLAIDAGYTPSGGPSRTIRAMEAAPDAPIGGFETKSKGSPIRLEVRISEVPEMAAGDGIEIAAARLAGSYVIATCDADDDGLAWIITLRVAA